MTADTPAVERHINRRILLISCALSTILIGALTLTAIALAPNREWKAAMPDGFLLAAANNVAAFTVIALALGRSRKSFMTIICLGNGLRIAAVLCILVAVNMTANPYFIPFASATIAGYFITLCFEVMGMHIVSTGIAIRRTRTYDQYR